MSSIYIQLIQRAKTLQAGDTVTLRFPLDTSHTERDLTVSGDIMPLLDEAESEYYVPDFLSDPNQLRTVGQTLYRWLDGNERFLTRD